MAVNYLPCNRSLGRNIGDEWVTVWSSLCLLRGAAEIEIAAGQQRTDTLYITTRLGSPESDEWAEPVGGLYRVWIGLFSEVGAISLSGRLSTPFRMEP